MTRKIFFSFHYKRDAWRAAQIRNSNVIAKDDEYGFIDSVDWETIERQGDEAVKRWINEQLKHTSVTVVLIGAQTAERDWVDYEIRRSWERGNALVGVRIDGMKNHEGKTDSAGANPFDNIRLVDGTPLSSVCKVHDWVLHDGRENLGAWVEEAFTSREAFDGETSLKKSGDVPPAPYVAVASTPRVINNPSKPWAR